MRQLRARGRARLAAAQALISSQVVLSFGIPFALVPLLLVTRDRAVMGELANRRMTSAALLLVTVVITGLNAVLAGQLISGAG